MLKLSKLSKLNKLNKLSKLSKLGKLSKLFLPMLQFWISFILYKRCNPPFHLH